MSNRRSDKVHEAWRRAAERFDYFVLSVVGALCAYISQTFKPVQIGVNAGTLELIALLLLVTSVFAGFRRIEKTIVITIQSHRVLWMSEERETLMSKINGGHVFEMATGNVLSVDMVASQIQKLTQDISELTTLTDRNQKVAMRWYRMRNTLLLVGFVALVLAKVWSAYAYSPSFSQSHLENVS